MKGAQERCCHGVCKGAEKGEGPDSGAGVRAFEEGPLEVQEGMYDKIYAGS
ncbi:hypothetical protein PSDVSF_23200 [Pseudodesulfovibrio sediminis]|uniref:Uncharacterized protein n=1 Tax=Pseudodesulfovibrio sediminis TaxID=2810563 RepID=A0ABN6ERR0_9BACT|nr:hypothetical protein PSDVSF_23200 [Pseudodesulfovibrio sediminis]